VTIEIEAEEAGEHLLVVHYANDERDIGHPYNTDISSRPIDISVKWWRAHQVLVHEHLVMGQLVSPKCFR
jgi:hypothetical protein